MKISSITQVNEFLELVNKSQNDVWLTSLYGDKYNLKSALSQYVAIAALLGEHGSELELWCENKEDEYAFLKFFSEHKDMM